MDSSTKSSGTWLSPGSLYFTGKKKVDEVKVTVIEFDEKSYSEKELKNFDEFSLILENKKVSWINIAGLHDTKTIGQIGTYFNLHPLLLEDILNVHHPPKIENYDEHLFIIVKMIDLNPIGGLNIEHICFILKENTLISFQEDEQDVFNILRQRIKENIGRIRKSGADYLMYRLLDSIVDGYISVNDTLEDRIELVEDKLILNPEFISIETIHNLRKEITNFRRSVYPLRDIVYTLQRERDRHIKKSTFFFIRDLADHLQHTIDSLEVFRDDINGMLELHLSASGRKLNEIIKFLTIISTIFIPLTFLAGLYGMNFNTASPWNMPELNWSYGYLFVLILMLLIASGLIVVFKRKKWF